MRRKAHWRLAAHLSAALVLINAPCFAQVSDDTIKLGVLDDMSGPYAENSGPGDVVAVKMAISDFGGTVFGKPIELVSGDLQNKADVGVGIARKWFDIEHVDAIFGLGNSAVALAVQKLAIEKEQNHHRDGCSYVRTDREVLFAQWRALGIRYLFSRQGCGDRYRQAGR